ncbi:MAG: TrmB family transcriptional regulator, partial [Halolamina sp.]
MPDDLRDALGRVAETFDFGDYEVRAYLTVLEGGEMTAAEIASEADIPQPRVYDTVRDLADEGFLELRESRPMTVRAVDPEDAFDDVRTSLDDLVEGLEERYTSPPRETEAAAVVRSRATIRRQLREVIEGAEYELVLSLTPDLVGRFEEPLRAAREAGVVVDLLVSPADEIPDPDAFDYTAVANRTRSRRGVTTPVLAIADGTDAVYATRAALEGDERYGVVFGRSELGFLVSAFFETVVLPTASTVVSVEDDRDWPRQYATVRRCVRSLEGAGGPFYATIQGRDVVTGEPRTVAGELVDRSAAADLGRASLTVATDDGPVVVGGQLAAVEDVEAHEIT